MPSIQYTDTFRHRSIVHIHITKYDRVNIKIHRGPSHVANDDESAQFSFVIADMVYNYTYMIHMIQTYGLTRDNRSGLQGFTYSLSWAAVHISKIPHMCRSQLLILTFREH